MIVTFKTRSHPRITYDGEVALRLLNLMGQDATVPGVMTPAELSDARNRLLTAIDIKEMLEDEPAADSDDDEAPIGLKQRALPLLQLLEAAEVDEAHVTWKIGWSLA